MRQRARNREERDGERGRERTNIRGNRKQKGEGKMGREKAGEGA